MIEETTLHELQNKIISIEKTLDEVKVIVRDTQKELSGISGSICGINERCKAENERIEKIEQKQESALMATLGAAVTAIIALAGMLFSVLTGK